MLLEVSRMGDNLKLLGGALFGAAVALLLVGVFSGGGMMGGMGPMMGSGMLGMLFGLVFWVVVLALIVALIVWIVWQIQSR